MNDMKKKLWLMERGEVVTNNVLIVRLNILKG